MKKKNKRFFDARKIRRKPIELLRVERIELVLSAEEKELIVSNANKKHMSVSTYIRDKLLNSSG